MSPRMLVLAVLCLAAGLGAGALLFGGGGEPDVPLAPTAEIDNWSHGVSTILIRVEEGKRDVGTALTLCRQAWRAIRGGESFEAVARARSEGPGAEQGGFIGFPSAYADTAFSGAVQTLRPGQMSVPLRTPLGWQIVKRHSFDEARALERRHWIPTHGFFVGWQGVNTQSTDTRSKQEAHALALQMMERLAGGRMTLEDGMARFTPEPLRRNQAYIGNTADREGMEAMYAALKDAEVGRIVGPVETKRGFGVLVRGRYLRSLFRHILVQHVHSEDRNLSVRRSRAEAKALARRALDEVLADRSRWRQVVERTSDEARTRLTEGTMGVLDPGMIPAGFEAVVYDMPPDSIHPDLVETPLGFHVLWKVN